MLNLGLKMSGIWEIVNNATIKLVVLIQRTQAKKCFPEWSVSAFSAD
jgi:hypothetical protein